MHLFEGEFTYETNQFSPLYFPPELKEAAAGKKDDEGELIKFEIKPYKADVWSMGIVAVALLCGEEGYDDDALWDDRLRGIMSKWGSKMAITSQDTVAEFVHTVFPFTTTDEWRTAEYKKARDFVNAALKYNPDERPTVADLLKMEFVA